MPEHMFIGTMGNLQPGILTALEYWGIALGGHAIYPARCGQISRWRIDSRFVDDMTKEVGRIWKIGKSQIAHRKGKGRRYGDEKTKNS